MLDTVQIVLLIVISLLTILLVVLGIQVYFILRELRRTVQKTNKILDTTEQITESVARPIESVSSLVDSVSTGAVLTKAVQIGLKAFQKRGKSDDE